MMDIYAYQGKTDEVKYLFKKGYLPTQSTMLYGLLSNNIETIKWLNRLVPLKEDLIEKLNEEINYEVHDYISKNIIIKKNKDNQQHKLINYSQNIQIPIINQFDINYLHQLQYLYNYQMQLQYMYINQQNFI